MNRMIKFQETPVPYYGKLTLSAGVITDDTRLAGVEGDGEAWPFGGAGVWPAATNIAAAVTISGVTGATVTDDSAESPLFNGVSAKVVTPGAALYEGGTTAVTSGMSSSTAYTVSVHVIAPVGATLRLRLTTYTAPGVPLSNYDTNFVGTGVRQVVSRTFTSDATAAKYLIAIQTITSNQAITFYMGNGGSGLQLETGSIATPFTPSSRVAGRIQAPASVLDETQMWVAARFVVPASYTNDYVTDPAVFSWGDDATNNIRMVRSNTANAWIFRRVATTPTYAAEATAHAALDTITLVGYCTATEIAISENGAAFTKQGGTQYIPTLAAIQADIGSDTPIFGSTDRVSGHGYYWFAAGKGTLTDADAALFHSWGSNDPLPHMFPRSAQLTFLAGFNADGTMYRYAA